MKVNTVFSVDCKVWSPNYGWGTVISNCGNSIAPVTVLFDNVFGYVDFTLDGKEYPLSPCPTLFFDNSIFPEDEKQSWIELYENCEEVEYVKDKENFFVVEISGKVFMERTTNSRYPLKYISFESARYIVENCKENAGGQYEGV